MLLLLSYRDWVRIVKGRERVVYESMYIYKRNIYIVKGFEFLMVNAPTMLRQQRLARITRISGIISRMQEEKKQIKYDNLILGLMNDLGVSRKTTMEYLDAALFSLGIDKETIK